jgi:hypothetical protein
MKDSFLWAPGVGALTFPDGGERQDLPHFVPTITNAARDGNACVPHAPHVTGRALRALGGRDDRDALRRHVPRLVSVADSLDDGRRALARIGAALVNALR